MNVSVWKKFVPGICSPLPSRKISSSVVNVPVKLLGPALPGLPA